MELSDKQTSEELSERVTITFDKNHIGRYADIIVDGKLWRIYPPIERTPDPRVVEVLREARKLIEHIGTTESEYDYQEAQELLPRIDAVLKGEK